ncbi:MAG: hypothetical protein M3362_02660, partial [Acidobacteriota bacterium]|nr:hypothetical protein [Acidobacteriota bacterium]
SVARAAGAIVGREGRALRVIPIASRGLTGACTRPATRIISCFAVGLGGRVMRGVMRFQANISRMLILATTSMRFATI